MDVLNKLSELGVPLFPRKAKYGEGRVPSKNRLAEMSFPELYNLRQALQTTEEQNAVAPYEHQAFTRGFVRDEMEAPIVGDIPELRAASMLGATVPYTYLKALGLDKLSGGDMGIGGEGRSDASAEEVVRALIGVGQGEYDVMARRLNKLREMLGI